MPSLWKYCARTEGREAFNSYLKLKEQKRKPRMVKGKELLEQLAKSNFGIRLELPKLFRPFELRNDLELYRDFIGRIYYCLDDKAIDDSDYPTKFIDGKLRRIFALYEDGKLEIYERPKKP